MKRTSRASQGRGIELIYSRDCPNVELARRRLAEALDTLGRAPTWTEWKRESPASPAYARGFGSPTILIDGRDVLGAPPCPADNCRVYPSAQGLDRAPSVPTLLEALRGATGDV